MNDIVIYRGQVVYINTTNPFPDLLVKITDGSNTHCQAQTDAGGEFSLKVRINEIDGSYYLLAGDSTCIPKKVALSGFGQAEVDLGTIEVEGPALPIVETKPIQTDLVTADAALVSGEVTSDGRLFVSARGICYSKSSQPTIDGLHTSEGTGKGAFSSTLNNLEHNTIYYARAYATNRMGTEYGEQRKFTTEAGVPVVRTDTVIESSITAHSAKCKGYVESDGGYKVTQRGTCWSTHHDPTIDDNCTKDGSGLEEFTSLLNNLKENTTYYVRAYATNSTDTKYGEEKSFTTKDGLAVVIANNVPDSTVTATSFIAYGSVTEDCDIPVTERGFCYATTQYPTVEGKHKAVGSGRGSFQTTISGLEYATTYYVRAYAINATATVYSDKQFEVKTLSGLPKVITDEQVTNISSVRATCGGNVTDDGTLTVTARGVCYGIEQQPTIEGLHTTDGRGLGEFTSNMKDLKDKTTYYVRAYATTDAGTTYGAERSFKTENGIPVVLIDTIYEPTANSVACKGNVTGDGGVTVTERGFCYSLNQYPINTSDHVAIGNGMGEFTGSLTGLALNTTYYIRAYAVNSLGVGYSEQQSFTTKNGLPTVKTGEATVTAVSISTSGEVLDNGGYAVTERGVCYSVTNSEPTIIDEKILGGKGNGTFNVTITGLEAATTYHLRAYATNENGTAYGEAVDVITKDGNATVELGEVINITALTASTSVTVTDANGANLKSCGICWATNPNPTLEDSSVVAKGKQLNTAYECNIADLNPNTTYYVRAYATTDIATSYSEQRTFTTTIGLPVVSIASITPAAKSLTCSGEITDNGGYPVTERGFCYSQTNSEPTILDTKLSSGSGNGTFNVTFTELSPSTTYYVRAYATNRNGTSYSEISSMATKNGLATVSVGEVTNITATTATGSVTVTDADGAILQSCGVCWSTNPNPTTTDSKSEAGGKQLNTPYTCNISELQSNTTYYIRAYATTDVATAYSEQQTFTTVTGLPIVKTGTTTASATSITCAGEVLEDGGYTILDRGICYSVDNSEPTILDSKLSGGSGKGTFNVSIKELSAATSYFVRAYATNMNGTSYGEVVPVVTKNGAATVVLGSINNITALTAGTSVTVTDADGATLQSCGVCWSINPNPTISNSTIVASGKQLNTSYPCVLTELQPNTTYYVRAYATTDITTTYSEEMTFNTVSGLPIVTTGVATSTSSTITASGEVTGNGGYYVTERGVCYSKTNSEPTISDAKIASGSGIGTFNVSITMLEPATTYYVRAYATNSIGTSYGDAVSVITKDGSASVLLSEVSNITALTASASVTVIDAGGATLQSCGICWSINPNPTISDNTIAASGKQLNTAYTCNLTELQPNTTYYVRAYATTDITTTYSEQADFKTNDGLPVVITSATTATSTAISSGGTITSDGGYSITARGVCYSTNNSSPTLDDEYTTAGTGSGYFSSVITNISVSTTYYVRAYATNSIGTAYGDPMIVETENGLPTVETINPGENISNTTITTGGNVIDDGGYTITSRGVVYATTPYPTITDAEVVSSGTGKGYYTSKITGVNIENYSYYVRAYATNINGTTYGEQYIVTPEKLEYVNLPTFTYGGYKYHMYYDMGIMAQEQGISACQNLVFGGYDDWYLPNVTELTAAAQAKIGGWVSMQNDTTIYWSSTTVVDFPYYYHYYVGIKIVNGVGYLIKATYYMDDGINRGFRIRAVRKDPFE